MSETSEAQAQTAGEPGDGPQVEPAGDAGSQSGTGGAGRKLPGGRAVALACAAFLGLLLGATLGFLAGWLTFGRAAPSPPAGQLAPGSAGARLTAGSLQVPAERIDHREEIARLAGSVGKLSEALERLAEESRRREAAAAARAEQAEPKKPPPRPAAPKPRIEPGVKFHSTFETGTDGWFVARFMPAIIGEVARTEKEGEAKVGKGALALSYVNEPGKIPLVVRTSVGINRLSLWLRTVNQPADVVIGVGERDDSNYQTVVHIEPGEGWRHFEFDLAAFTLSDDSEDENDTLDYHEIRSVAVIEAAGFMGGEGENVLLIDEVIGEYRAGQGGAEAPPEEGDRERF